MERSRLRRLLIDYSLNRIEATDLEALLDYVSERGQTADLDSLMAELLDELTVDGDLALDSEDVYRRIKAHPKFGPAAGKRTRWRWVYGTAAAVFLAIGVAALLNFERADKRDAKTGQTEVTRTVTSSPTEKPLLRLANGRVVDLDEAATGLLAVDDGTPIHFDGFTLSYGDEPVQGTDDAATNTVIVPKGRQYQLLLPDGSSIRLNAATTLTYPVRFGADKREVSISGEAYFEIKKAIQWPFVVHTSLQQIEVLGTEFNVSAYADDHLTKTTLVTGQVGVSAAAGSRRQSGKSDTRLSTPGQQAVSGGDDEAIITREVELEGVVSWKNNLFVFDGEEVSDVMKQVTRWYDVEVVYKDGVAGKRIGGSIPRFETVAEMMDALAATGLVRYRMEGRRVVIMK